MRKSLLSFIAVLVLAGTTRPSSPDEPVPANVGERRAALARRLRERVRALDYLRENAVRQRAEHSRRVGVVDRQIERLRADLERVRVERLDASTRLAERRARLDEIRAALNRSSDALARLARAALGHLRAVEARVRAGLPIDLEERLAELAAVAGGLESKDAVTRASGLERFLSFLEDELQRSRARDVRGELLELPGDAKRHARVFQLGLVSVLYRLETGDGVGRASTPARGGWVSSTREDVRARIRAVFDVVEKRAVPAFVPVPIDSARVRVSEEAR